MKNFAQSNPDLNEPSRENMELKWSWETKSIVGRNLEWTPNSGRIPLALACWVDKWGENKIGQFMV